MKPDKKSVLILGGEGFIGRNIVEQIAGYCKCRSIGIERSVFKERQDKFIRADPYKDKIKNDYDVIIHLIDSQTETDGLSASEKKLAENINLNQKNHLIVFSSAIVYANPKSDYGKRKAAFEKFYLDYCAENKIKLLILRLFNIYGPYQYPGRRGSLVANVFCNYLNGTATEINDLEAERDFIYSRDMAKAVESAIKNKIEGHDDLASNRMTSLKSLIESMEKVAENKIVISHKNMKEHFFCPAAKSKIIKNIKLTELRDGLAETLNFYKMQKILWRNIRTS